ncbi:hypothetical protein N643_13895 [Salmonella bongori serovar 48:z41:-- str. RKS3044]|uniref:Putative cytoplasmic protein n=1 Tax=Salmonella bongori N268-08 TaxID=1197719 RepID=S5MUK2_SALBN|nr:putative cytoplasmic protein [Salmonella bongori N268-08]AID27509.1 hypothetical protein N643_13895 [Salmonella bongori serovar 48:z41:-- str. RKS3044]
MPGWIVTLSHPDFNRRPRNYTGSADLFAIAKSARGLSAGPAIFVSVYRNKKPLNIADLPPVGNFAPP